ncbi:hypothetical protein [Algisphaera agarilytica]|uniref:Mn2+/Fe2+ NRAMP family transporter n=1 Tax=Algisphaera agarilytica TaxID=1385975 RepID=A0A7X0H8X5_9BACT|nr:hypothetical protein [Algisphaera agarilytica]MBB6431438.1 Mn2+/Fe2+ NRAMP family transporter [Algisphaera agarilytica]
MSSTNDSPKSLIQTLKQLGPGFLQSACTIGGGTLGACLFLGSFAGLSALWIQPFAMLLGVGVLLMITHVTLSTEKSPFGQINQHVSPVLGWGWLIATVAANMVWGLPQYNLGTDALTQMVVPGVLGKDGALGGEGGTMGRVIATAVMAGCAVGIMLTQLRKGKGGRLFDRLIQLVVAGIVICFGAVVIKLLSTGSLSIGSIAQGFIPSPSLFFEPASGYTEMLGQSVNVEFWSDRITTSQRNTALAAISAAVGINMTFLMPYTLLARGWGKSQRGLARTDLFVGLLIPFILVSGFVVSAAAATLHGKANVNQALIEWKFSDPGEANPSGLGPYRDNLVAFAKDNIEGWDKETKAKDKTPEQVAQDNVLLDTIPESERLIAAATIKHGTAALGATLESLFNGKTGVFIFGVGVFFIALSTVLVHMLINGYALEVGFGIPRQIGSLLPLVAVIGPFFWGELSAYLVIPTSMIGLMLLPVALWGFLLLGQQKKLGDAKFGPVMLVVGIFVTVVYTLLSAWAAYGKIGDWLTKTIDGISPKIGWVGPGLIAAVAVAALLTSPLVRGKKSESSDAAE